MAKRDALERYKAKRDFTVTKEPAEGGRSNESAPSFVIQKHWARRLHYDFRLELDGAMKSWAVPKGPSLDPADKRMAVHVEDHPIAYNEFEGEIPAGQYGAGKVVIWDKGSWSALGNGERAYKEGKLKFELHGHKLQGRWALIRIRGRESDKDPWLLIKEQDEFARPSSEFSVVDEMPESVAQLDEPASSASAELKVSPLSEAPKAALPATLKPQLATLVDSPPRNDEDWVYEIKYDGYRLLTRVQGGKPRFITRNGHDWTEKLPRLAKDVRALKLPDGWYDGEIVVLGEDDQPDFQALQNAFDTARTQDIVYYLFDLPFCDGRDLRHIPVVERRARLEALLHDEKGRERSEVVRFSAAFKARGHDIVASACHLGLEGIIGKRKDAAYVSRRSDSWIKLKCSLRQEFVIGGYTEPQGSRHGLGALLLGFYDEGGVLQYAGKVGTGFNADTLTRVRAALDKLATNKRPFAAATDSDRQARWVRPVLVAEVSFGQWTRSGRIRHAVFHGLREDKPARAITKESAMSTRSTTTKPAGDAQPHSTLGNMKISNPDRVIDKSTGLQKIDLLRYYGLVGPLMMPHLDGRPVSFVRAPQGVDGAMFFQKHLESYKMAGVRQLPQHLDPDHDALMEVATAKGLLSAAQMNVIELHTWNARKTRIDRPDRMTFDLDPGKGVDWPTMQEAAVLLRAVLTELELPAFLKTSGGKGLHVIVPIQRRHDWEAVKGFSHAIVKHMATTLPSRFSAKSGPKNRVGKIFIDYLRNGFGATTVSAWSARARPGMGVSIPITWEELDHIKSGAHWHIGNIHERLDKGNTPWAEYDGAARSLGRAMQILGYTPDS